MKSVALLETVDPMATTYFENAGYNVEIMPSNSGPDTIAALAQENTVFGIRSKPAVGPEAFRDGSVLEAIGCYCIGTDQIDLRAATERGVAVFNSRYENSRSVVELTVGNIIGLLRRTGEHNRSMHAGHWSKTERNSYEVRGKTLGIIGYGSIGSQVSVVAESLGMTVKYYDPDPKFPSYGKAQRQLSLDELLPQADVVTLHVPGTPHTKNLMNAAMIAKMKPGSYLINTSRGDVVDYGAVREALESGQLKGMAADVFKPEPAKRGDKFEHPLRGFPNVLLTPHIAGSTVESSMGIARDTSTKLLGYLATGTSIGSVNLPEMSLPPVRPGVTRLLHIHENVPRVDAAVADVIANSDLNVAAKVLQTRQHLGYVAVDVEGSISADTLQAIEAVRHTIRVRTITPNPSEA